MDYTPWCLYGTLYKKNGTEIIQTDYREWVIKRMTDSERMCREIKILLKILDNAPRHSITVPPSICRFYDYNGWYVMKRYTDEVHRNSFCKDHWKIIGIHVLQFLQDLHHNHRKVHMDIKKANILYDKNTCEFVVTDYELVRRIDSTYTRDLDGDHMWYYMAMGAELKEPVFSWRTDLVALGYALGSLMGNSWSFEQQCYDHRTFDGGRMNMSAILELRAEEVAAITQPEINAYLALVDTIPWDSDEPPPKAFYEELEALFNTPSDTQPEQ